MAHNNGNGNGTSGGTGNAASAPTPTPTASRKAALRDLRIEASTIEAQMRLDHVRTVQAQLKESSVAQQLSPWLAFTTDRLKQWQTQPSQYLTTSKNDRRGGRNFPIFQTESELAIHRQLSRILLATNNYAIGLLEGITSYVVADGMTYRMASVDDDTPAPKSLLQALQRIVDEVQEQNDWSGGGQPNMEEELFRRSVEDGEFFVVSWVDPNEGWTSFRTVEPEHVTQPPDLIADENWRFGIRNREGDVQTHEGYWIMTGEVADKGQEFSCDAVTHYRRNVKRSIKRGFPDFSFDVYDSLDNASKLRKAIGLGAALQASIAGIRQHENATKSQVTSFVNALEDFSRTNPVTGNAESTHRREPGMFLDIPKGLEYVPPPGYANANDFVSILQAILRGAGQRWNAPEWLSAASVNETVYASALVGESPFVRTIKREQTGYAECFRRLHWKAVRNRMRALGDRLRVVERKGDQVQELEFTWEQICELVRLQVEPASVEVRNRGEEATMNQTLVGMKAKSPQTVCQEQGLDWDQEAANWEEFEERFGQQMAQLELPGDSMSGADTGGGAGGGAAGTDASPPDPTKAEPGIAELLQQGGGKQEAA